MTHPWLQQATSSGSHPDATPTEEEIDKMCNEVSQRLQEAVDEATQ